MRRLARLLLIVVATLAAPRAGFAQSTAPDLARASIEDLMNIEITSVSHKEQRVGDVAGAVFVLTQADIRHSGMTTVPELLRLVPGVQVARINSNKWAVSIRGFNNLFDDKLLVLVDGRTVYDRLNSGLFWESLNVPLDQIDRIEVIRGPGGAAWGANAVNGVINIVTRPAADLQGAAISAGGGTLEGAQASARYGGTIGRATYRVYSQFADHGQSELEGGAPAHDDWQSQTHGGRVDWAGGRDTILAEGGTTIGKLHNLSAGSSGPVPAVLPTPLDWTYTHEYDVLGRWTHRRDSGASLQLQASSDSHSNDDDIGTSQIQNDVDAQYRTPLGVRHDVVVGAGYRYIDENAIGAFVFSITPSHVNESVVNLFAQDEIAMGRRVALTLGAKVERDSRVGWSIQPTARLMWNVVPGAQHVWAAVSRAVRTPSLGDMFGRYNYASAIGPGGLPLVIGALGNPAFQSEEVVSTEAGYRRDLGSAASVDVTAFVGRYDRLKTSEPLTPFVETTPAPVHLLIPVQFENLLAATTSGVEISAHWAPAAWWRIDGGYSTFHLTPRVSATSLDLAAAAFDGNAPREQWQLRSGLSLRRVALDLMLFHSGALRDVSVAAYTRADAHLELPLTRILSLSVTGQNLFDPAHAEFAGQGAIVMPTLIPRSAAVNLVWMSRR